MAGIDDQVVRDALRRRLQPRGAAKALAEQLGLSTAYLSQMKGGDKPVSPRVAELLGYRRTIQWEPILGSASDPS